jgi:quinol monooxygenase YgiN
MVPLVVVAFITAKPGKADELRATLIALIAPTLAEAGCLRYELNEASSGIEWVFTEQWESREIWDQHMVSPHLMHFKSMMDILVDKFDLFTGSKVDFA